MMTRIKTPQEIEAMRVSGGMLGAVLNLLKQNTKAGVSTKDLADLAAQELKSLGGKPAFLGYQGFPDVLCTSINEEVVHGIPSHAKIIQGGDIVSLDFGVVYQSMVTDGAISFTVGRADAKYDRLVKATEESMMAGIDAVKDGVRTGDIGSAVEEVLSKHGYGIVRDLVGHGVGHTLHEDPNVPNYGRKSTGTKLSAGMTIAIEPMATLGSEKVVLDRDGWTVLTYDDSWSAHFEHTVLITEKGAEILTLA